MEIPVEVTGREREEWLISSYIIDKVTGKASGVEDQECLLNYPRDIYFIGNLRPRNNDEASLNRAEFMNKLAPSAFGAEFKVDNSEEHAEISVELSWFNYYRAFPTYQQQLDWANQVANNEAGSNQNTTRREDLFIRFKKIKGSATGIIKLIKEGDQGWAVDTSDLESKIQEEIIRIRTEVLEDDERLRLRTQGRMFTLTADSLSSMENYNQFLDSLNIENENSWNWEVNSQIYSVQQDSNETIILIQFVNSSDHRLSDKWFEPYIFNAQAKFIFNKGKVLPFELELAPKSFRYNRNIWGKGFNCGLEHHDEYFITNHTPIHPQWRYRTSNVPEASFERLANDPVPILNEILDAMSSYVGIWDSQQEAYIEKFGRDFWQHNYQEEYLKDKEKFEEEITLFKAGLDLIDQDQDILFAFKLSNESFRRAGLNVHGQAVKDKWRLFQIVFMVSQIPSVVGLNPEYEEHIEQREFADIIYFPTGGGKTEAYLSTLIFHCFYDRLREKTAGVTSWIRFPLRLLTIQQTQRLANIIGLAELVRKEQDDSRLVGENIDGFSVGYFVGAEATPNEIKVPQNGRPEPTWSQAIDENARQRWQRVVNCPSCKTNSVKVDFDQTRVKVIHRCQNNDCKFEAGEIPVRVIDNEIYRYLPTVIVGTIDKLAGIGNQRKFSLVFGKVDGYCEVHGYFNNKCCQKDCNDQNRLIHMPPRGVSGPTLFIQDELHLLKEGLGTFDSHYETFTQYLLREAGSDKPLKIIASSATIERYERQVEHLYGKNPNLARVFPGFGPTLKDSFYAQTEIYPQRIFVGIIPHNKTIFNAVLELLEYYHELLQILSGLSSGENPFLGSTTPGSDEWYKLLDLYYSSLSYFMSSRDLDAIKTDVESHINNAKFANSGFRPVDIKELTGKTSTNEVTRTLEQLEQYHSPEQSHEVVLATNMVSHGVDIDRFNSMIFYGIPRQNAEYIQASSRVGRSHIGIVFDCFHPIRERDQSHYSYFKKYHEFLGQLVEPVAINRWSAFGIDKTLPGLFMATLLQIMSNRENGINRNQYYMLNKISQMYQSRDLDKAEIKRILVSAFNSGIPSDDRNISVQDKIERAVDIYFDSITNPGVDSTFVSEALMPRPMRSLRDIDEPVDIELDRLGERWANTN